MSASISATEKADEVELCAQAIAAAGRSAQLRPQGHVARRLRPCAQPAPAAHRLHLGGRSRPAPACGGRAGEGALTERRFTSHPDLDPMSVRSLPSNHPAMVGNRTLFPSTVVDVTRDTPDRLLVSGANNRKLGATIIKGIYAGYLLYGLSLEERATCPTSCLVRGHCYGNGMQMARRHRIVDLDVFQERLAGEIDQIIRASANGLMVRLHVLGDFPSVDYVAMWADLLTEHPKLACYGYTHRLPKRVGGEIGTAIAGLKADSAGPLPRPLVIRHDRDRLRARHPLRPARRPGRAGRRLPGAAQGRYVLRRLLLLLGASDQARQCRFHSPRREVDGGRSSERTAGNLARPARSSISTGHKVGAAGIEPARLGPCTYLAAARGRTAVRRRRR